MANKFGRDQFGGECMRGEFFEAIKDHDKEADQAKNFDESLKLRKFSSSGLAKLKLKTEEKLMLLATTFFLRETVTGFRAELYVKNKRHYS